MGVNLLPHCLSGGITTMDMAILRGGDFLYLASEKQQKKVNQGDRKPLGLYNGTGLQGVPGISPSSKQGETVQQHLDVVSYFFCSLSTTFRKLKWSQLQRSE